MALSHSPSIVTNGLILNLDAGNRRSYPGSGNTWFDTSGFKNNASIGANLSFNQAAGGNIKFNYGGTITTINTSSITNLTIEIWLYLEPFFPDVDLYTYNSTIPSSFRIQAPNSGWNTRTDGNNVAARCFGFTIPSQQWIRFCYVKNADAYVNQVKYGGGCGSDTAYNTIILGNTRGSSFFIGNMACVKIYNRSLSDQEISQNFNALRGRFGI